MRRRASDNPYLHKDFHGILSAGLIYLEKEYGAAAVGDYLRNFTRRYHAPLREAIRDEGLAPLRAYLERVYGDEGAQYTLTESAEELTLELAANPALMHLRRNGYPVSPLFHDTTDTVYGTLCEDTPWAFENTLHDPVTGAARLRFFKRSTTT